MTTPAPTDETTAREWIGGTAVTGSESATGSAVGTGKEPVPAGGSSADELPSQRNGTTVRAVRSHDEILEAVNDAIQASLLGTWVVVANPWRAVNLVGVCASDKVIAGVPPLLPADKVTITPQERLAIPILLRDKPLEELHAWSRATWLTWGIDFLRQQPHAPLALQSTEIASAVVGLLASTGRGLLEPGFCLEVCTMVTSGTSGHALVVVNRASGSDPLKAATWGPAAFIIDQWFALQQSRSRRNAVKKLTEGSTHHDPAYVTFFNKNPRLRVDARFTSNWAGST